MSSERESANLAFYAIVYSKGLVEKQQLQGALNKATLDGLPLETVLLEAGAIKPGDCVEVLSQRAELGRTCRECEGVTYVLPDEDASTKKCESCGGRLRRSRREEREARRTERKKRVAAGATQSHKRRPAGSGVGAVGGKELKALVERLDALEEKLSEQVHQAVDTRLAQEDLRGQIEQTLAQADLSGIVDRVSDEALGIVSARVEEADLSGLYDRVAEEALQKVSGRLPADASGETASVAGAAAAPVDTQAIVEDATDAAAEQVLRSVRAELEALEEAAVEKASQRALAMMQELKESSEEQASLAENSRLALEEMLSQYDLPTLTDRISEQVLRAVEEREADGEAGEARPGAGAPAPEVLERIESIDAAMQELLDEMVELSVPQMKQDLDALTKLDVAAQLAELSELRAANAALEKQVEALRTSPPKVDIDLNALRTELREEAVEVAVRKAVSAAQQEVQNAGVESHGAGLEGISEATDQVTAQVMQRVEGKLEEQAKQLADQAMLIIQKSLGAMDMSALTNKVMNEAFAGVEERLAGMDLGGGGGGGALDIDAITAAVLPALQERIDQDLEGLPDRIGQQAAAPVLEAIESRIEKLDLRNLPSKVAAEALPVITEQVKAEVMAQVGAAGGGGNGEGGASSEELQKTKAGILEWVESRFAQTPPPEAIVQMASSKAVDALEERLGGIEVKLAELEAAALGGMGGGSGGPSPDEVAMVVQAQIMGEVESRLAAVTANGGGGGDAIDGAAVAELAAQNALAAVEARLADVGGGGGGGGVTAEQVEEIARKAALEVGAARSGSEELSEMAVPTGSSVIKLPGFEKKFISLAKEVKNLRQTLTRMQAVQNESVVSSTPTGGGGGGGGGDLVAALNSPEFKQLFDTKINQVMSYMKSDVIPKTVKKIIADQ